MPPRQEADFGGIPPFSRLARGLLDASISILPARSRPMVVFSRLSDIINSNLNAILDRAEDPQKIVRLIIQEMEDTLVEVRSSAVRTIAEKKEIERRLATLEREQEEWQRRAELAVTKGREDLAKGALLAK